MCRGILGDASTSFAISEEKLVESEETEAIKIRPFLRPTAKCFAILGCAIIAKVSTDSLKSHWDPHILRNFTLLKCPQLCLWIVSARDLPVSVKDCKTSPAITRRRVGEVEDNPLPVISHNKMHKTSKFLFILSSYFLQHNIN